MSAKKRKKDQKQKYVFQGVELNQVALTLGKKSNAIVSELQSTAENIKNLKGCNLIEQKAGLVAEEWHAGTFNVSSIKNNSSLRAMTGTQGGFSTDPRVDIRVTDGQNNILEVQSKYCKSAARTAVAISKPQYDGTERLVPAEQAKEIKSILVRKVDERALSTNSTVQQKRIHRQDAAEHVTDKIKVGNIESTPLSVKEAQKLAEDPSIINKMIMQEKVVSSLKNGAISGAIFGCCSSSISNVRQGLSGEKGTVDVIKDISKDTLSASAKSATTSLVAEGVKATAKNVLPQASAKSIVGGSAPMAIAGCAVELTIDFCKGDLDGKKAAKTVGRAAASWGGAEGGAMLGTFLCPGIGTVIGGVIGGILGGICVDTIL